MNWPRDEYRKGLADVMSYEYSANEVYLPAYAIGLKDLAAGCQMDCAVLTGWRVFMPQPDGGALFCEMILDSEGQPLQLGCVSEGDRAKDAWKALQAAQARPEVAYCELRWLSVPCVMFEGFWLKSNDANKPDPIIPVFTLDESLNREILVAMDFLAITKPFGLNRLAYNDCPQYGLP